MDNGQYKGQQFRGGERIVSPTFSARLIDSRASGEGKEVRE